MPRTRVLLAAAAILLGAAATARADQAQGAACARTLSPDALKIYSLTAPGLGRDTPIRDALTSTVRPLVLTGQMGIGAARTAAGAAAECLEALRR